jgi:ferredoxin
MKMEIKKLTPRKMLISSIEFDKNKCIKCGRCIASCPTSIIDKKNMYPN